MTWRAKTWIGVPLGLLFIALLAVLDGWLLSRLLIPNLRDQQIDLFGFLLGLLVLLTIPLVLFLVYQTVSCLTLRYHLDRNALSVRWWGVQQIIPIRDIQRILPGAELNGNTMRRRGVRWPGHERGEGLVPQVGTTHFLATRPLAEQLLVVTPGMALAISPRDRAGFLDAYQARSELGPNRLSEAGIWRHGWLAWPLWADRTARALLATAAAVNLALFGYLCALFPGLDDQLPLHFNIEGMADRIGTRAELFTLPIIGLIILGTNLLLGLILYRRARAGSYLLWGAAIAAQALFWLATFSIVR